MSGPSTRLWGPAYARLRVALHRGMWGRRRPYDRDYVAGRISAAEWEDSLHWDHHRW